MNNDRQINSKKDQYEIEITEENKIEPVYNYSDENKGGRNNILNIYPENQTPNSDNIKKSSTDNFSNLDNNENKYINMNEGAQDEINQNKEKEETTIPYQNNNFSGPYNECFNQNNNNGLNENIYQPIYRPDNQVYAHHGMPHHFVDNHPLYHPIPPHGLYRIPVLPPHGPHFPHYGPNEFMPHGPHMTSLSHIMPFSQNNDNQYEGNNEEDEKDDEYDVAFNSNKGDIQIYDNNGINNREGAYNENMNNNFNYNHSFDFNSNYIPNRFQDSYNPNSYSYNEGRIKPMNIINQKGNQSKIKEESKFNEKNKKKILNYNLIPLYIDKRLPKSTLIKNKLCSSLNKSENIKNSFPIILIYNHNYYDLFKEFLDKNIKYNEYNNIQILKNKLILSKTDLINQYKEDHISNNFNIQKFANVTYSLSSLIYKKEDHDNIINEIKKGINEGEIFYEKFINKWLKLVMNLLVEFMKFKLKKISYYYHCNICNFHCLYISDFIEEELNIEEKYNDKMIIYSINAVNELMEIINIHQYKNNENKNKENIINVICYEEEYNYMNYSFENEINGTFINCNNIKSFNKIMNEISNNNIIIQNKNSKKKSKIKFNITNNYMFELIISAIYIDKVFQYLINNNYFKFFKGICILIDDKINNNINNNLLLIKKKYNGHIKDIYIAQNDVFEFLKNAKNNKKYYNNKKYVINKPSIDFNNYISNYLKMHKDISFYYNKYSNNSSEIFYKIIIDFLNSMNINNNKIQNNSKMEIKQEKKEKINNIIKIFDEIRKQLIEEKKMLYLNNSNLVNYINKYIGNYYLFKEDFNFWLNNLDNLSYEKLDYLIGCLMYTIDTSLYITIENKNIEEEKDQNHIILYKEFIGNYIDLLIHENNKHKLITFPYFLICSKKLMSLSDKDDDEYYIIYRIKYNINNQYDYVQTLYELNEGEKVFQMFTFFRITDVKIKRSEQKGIIYLEPINKKDYLELKLKNDDTIVYNYNLNIIETTRYNNNNNIQENEYINNQNNLYITANDQLYNNIDDESENNEIKVTKFMQFFNNKYGTNLNSEMTSISMEENNMKNIGLLILSKTNLKNLIVLNLGKNNISDISPLGNCNFPKLKKLSLESAKDTLPQNKISDISPLIHSNFPELFVLNLKNNLIKDISYLLFMNFPSLIILNLSYNQIESVVVFSEVNFPNLETLDLSNNLINDITPFISFGKKKSLKGVENSAILNSSNISASNLLSKSVANNENIKKNMILPNLKTLKIKNNKLIIDEGYLMTIKNLKSRGITIFK